MNLNDLISSLRALAGDGPTSKAIFNEPITADPATPADGTNKYFRVKSVPVVASSVYITTIGSSYRSQTGFSTDLTTGIITFSSAPANLADLRADYNYQWFADADYTIFIQRAADNLQVGAATDPTAVGSGLVPAMLQYALANFFRARASQYQERYSSSGGDAGQSVESVAKGFAALAKEASARGDTLRDSYYKKQGQQFDPAYNSPASYPTPAFDPITPRR